MLMMVMSQTRGWQVANQARPSSSLVFALICYTSPISFYDPSPNFCYTYPFFYPLPHIFVTPTQFLIFVRKRQGNPRLPVLVLICSTTCPMTPVLIICACWPIIMWGQWRLHRQGHILQTGPTKAKIQLGISNCNHYHMRPMALTQAKQGLSRSRCVPQPASICH